MCFFRVGIIVSYTTHVIYTSYSYDYTSGLKINTYGRGV